jgi:site-specific recombinase XerD
MTTHLPTQVTTHDTTHVVTRVLPPVLSSELADKVADLRKASKAVNTQRAYQSDWQRWQNWCNAQGFDSMPAHPDTVSAYLADQAGTVKVATLARHLATISKAHQVAGMPSPCRETSVRDTMSGLRKTYGTKQAEAPGLLADSLATTLDTLSGDLSGLRDRALLLIGWCAGLRRSEIAGLTWGDMGADPDGLIITLAKSKTDQEGQGRIVGIANNENPGRCPVLALSAWREAVELVNPEAVAEDMPVFVTISKWGKMGITNLTGQAVAKVIERRTAQAGLPVRYQGHSLRKGLVQTAYLAGVSDSQVMKTTGHQSVTMLVRYQGKAGVVSRSASKGLLA